MQAAKDLHLLLLRLARPHDRHVLRKRRTTLLAVDKQASDSDGRAGPALALRRRNTKTDRMRAILEPVRQHLHVRIVQLPVVRPQLFALEASAVDRDLEIARIGTGREERAGRGPRERECELRAGGLAPDRLSADEVVALRPRHGGPVRLGDPPPLPELQRILWHDCRPKVRASVHRRRQRPRCWRLRRVKRLSDRLQHHARGELASLRRRMAVGILLPGHPARAGRGDQRRAYVRDFRAVMPGDGGVHGVVRGNGPLLQEGVLSHVDHQRDHHRAGWVSQQHLTDCPLDAADASRIRKMPVLVVVDDFLEDKEIRHALRENILPQPERRRIRASRGEPGSDLRELNLRVLCAQPLHHPRTVPLRHLRDRSAEECDFRAKRRTERQNGARGNQHQFLHFAFHFESIRYMPRIGRRVKAVERLERMDG